MINSIFWGSPGLTRLLSLTPLSEEEFQSKGVSRSQVTGADRTGGRAVGSSENTWV